MQKEQLIFKIVLKFETDQLKTKSTYINQQNQRSFTELTLDGVQMVPGKIVPCRKRSFDWGEVFMRGSRIFPEGGGGVGRGSKGYLGLLVVGMGKGLPSVQAVCSLFAYIR